MVTDAPAKESVIVVFVSTNCSKVFSMGARILIIDDEEQFCEILSFNLAKEGYDVDTASSAVEALEKDLTSYQLFIVDINMEQMNGYEFVEEIGRRLDTTKMPVIFCSCHDDEDHKVKGLELGADDYISKPFNLKEVSLRVRSVLHRCYPEL